MKIEEGKYYETGEYPPDIIGPMNREHESYDYPWSGSSKRIEGTCIRYMNSGAYFLTTGSEFDLVREHVVVENPLTPFEEENKRLREALGTISEWCEQVITCAFVSREVAEGFNQIAREAALALSTPQAETT